MSSTSCAKSRPSRPRTAIPRPRASRPAARPRPAYYQRRFGVELDPDREVIVTLGSKEGLANLAQAITAPGDVVLTPNPSYPIHHFGFIIAGASIRSIPAVPGPDFFDRLERAMRYTVPRPKVLVIGYPSNPTAQVVDLAFYEQLVAFARGRGLWSSPTSPMPRSTSATSARRRSSRCRAPRKWRSSSPRCPRPIRWPAGGWASRSATSG